MLSVGHQQNQYRPTGQNVRIDAARILEEILEQRWDEDLKYRKVRRVKTGPDVEKVSNYINESENLIKRSQTIPANYRQASKDEVKQSENEALLDKIHSELKPQDVDPGGSGSSADTEENLSLVSEKQKKKSFLKRAKERLIFTFRRDQKGGSVKVKDKTTLKAPNSKTQRNGEVKKQSKDVKEIIPEGKSVYQTQENNHPSKNGRMPTAAPPVKKEKGKLWNSFRRSKKPSQVTRNGNLQRDSADGRQPKGARSRSDNDSNTAQRETESHPINQTFAEEEIVKSPTSGALKQPHESPDQQSVDRSPPSTNEAHSSLHTSAPSPSMSTHDTIASGRTSASSNDIIPPENTSKAPEYDVASFQSSVLDCPGDDIQFIDAIDSENGENHGIEDRENETKLFTMAAIQFSGTRGKNNMNFPASQSPDTVHVPDFEKRATSAHDRIHTSTETTTIDAITGDIIQDIRHRGYDGPYDELDGAHDELDGAHDEQDGAHFRQDVPHNEPQDGAHFRQDVPHNEPQDVPHNEPQDAAPDREAMYSLIAQKLIDMADSYTPAGSEKPKPSPPELQEPLSALEIEIREWVRTVGDRATKQNKDDMYKRFHSTMQNSLGSELSWNHVAFFFNASRDVISTLGKGTRAAKMVKDFTLQYVNDTFASWITDQGGFDSLVSSDESDFGVD